MLELINLSTWPEQLEYFRSRQGGLAGFLREFDLDGVELIQAGPIEISAAGIFPSGLTGWISIVEIQILWPLAFLMRNAFLTIMAVPIPGNWPGSGPGN